MFASSLFRVYSSIKTSCALIRATKHYHPAVQLVSQLLYKPEIPSSDWLTSRNAVMITNARIRRAKVCAGGRLIIRTSTVLLCHRTYLDLAPVDRAGGPGWRLSKNATEQLSSSAQTHTCDPQERPVERGQLLPVLEDLMLYQVLSSRGQFSNIF